MKIPDAYLMREMKYRKGDNFRVDLCESNTVNIDKLVEFLIKAKDDDQKYVEIKYDRDGNDRFLFIYWSMWSQETDEEYDERIKKILYKEQNCVRRALLMERNSYLKTKELFEGDEENQKLLRAKRALRFQEVTPEEIEEVDLLFQDAIATGKTGYEGED